MGKKRQKPEPARLRRAAAEAQRLSRELHDGVIGPSVAEYMAWQEDGRAYNTSSIYRIFGSWEAFLAHCGLEMASRRYYQRAGRERQARLQAQLDEEFERLERMRREMRLAEEFRGLPIGRVRRAVVYDTTRHVWREMTLMEVR